MTSAMVPAGMLSGRLLYLLPHQMRQIMTGDDVIASCEGRAYRFVRIDKDGTFELRRVAGLSDKNTIQKLMFVDHPK
jgi:hypothetical protein